MTIKSNVVSLVAPSAGLTSKDHATRSASLAAVRARAERDHTDRLRKLQDEIAKSEARRTKEIADADATALATRQAQADEIRAKFLASFTEAYTEWSKVPSREASEKIRRALTDAREAQSLRAGIEVDPVRIVCYAISDVQRASDPAAVSKFSDVGNSSDTLPADHFEYALRETRKPPAEKVAFYNWLLSIEENHEKCVSRWPSEAQDTAEEIFAEYLTLIFRGEDTTPIWYRARARHFKALGFKPVTNGFNKGQWFNPEDVARARENASLIPRS